jgi:succinate-semialdehyde dehydrogenase/glutarate-semialdehyde dehydrogenase
VIVCADAAMGAVLRLSVPAKYRNAGQVCASPIRFLVHRSLYDGFVREFVAAAAALRLGPGSDAATQMGPLTHAGRLDDMARFVDDARDRGAHVLTGGRRAAGLLLRADRDRRRTGCQPRDAGRTVRPDRGDRTVRRSG